MKKAYSSPKNEIITFSAKEQILAIGYSKEGYGFDVGYDDDSWYSYLNG